jgi:hypothetical protein
LKETIEEVYSSKTRHDKKAAAAHLPRETLDEHLHTYLTTRYGLRKLIAEQGRAIREGVERYAAEDASVATFGAVLTGQVDEGFVHSQHTLGSMVRELLHASLSRKYPLKTESDLLAMIKKREAGEVEVAEDEWGDVVACVGRPRPLLHIPFRAAPVAVLTQARLGPLAGTYSPRRRPTSCAAL